MMTAFATIGLMVTSFGQGIWLGWLLWGKKLKENDRKSLECYHYEVRDELTAKLRELDKK